MAGCCQAHRCPMHGGPLRGVGLATCVHTASKDRPRPLRVRVAAHAGYPGDIPPPPRTGHQGRGPSPGYRDAGDGPGTDLGMPLGKPMPPPPASIPGGGGLRAGSSAELRSGSSVGANWPRLPDLCRVVFNLSYQVQFGQTLRVIGNVPSLGSWVTESGIDMEWCPGDNWRAIAEVRPVAYFLRDICLVFRIASAARRAPMLPCALGVVFLSRYLGSASRLSTRFGHRWLSNPAEYA